MRERDLAVAIKLKQELSQIVTIVDMRIYGSRARGEASEYSDLDVFLEVETLNKATKDKILDIVWEVSYENLLVIAPLIFTRDEIENSVLRSSPIVKNILREGVVM